MDINCSKLVENDDGSLTITTDTDDDFNRLIELLKEHGIPERKQYKHTTMTTTVQNQLPEKDSNRKMTQTERNTGVERNYSEMNKYLTNEISPSDIAEHLTELRCYYLQLALIGAERAECSTENIISHSYHLGRLAEIFKSI